MNRREFLKTGGALLGGGLATKYLASCEPPKSDWKDLCASVNLQDQDGNTLHWTRLAGKTVIVNFAYLSCGQDGVSDTCPVMFSQIAQFERSLPKDAVVLTISLDPFEDKDTRLKAQSQQVDPLKGARWIWSRPNKPESQKLDFVTQRMDAQEIYRKIATGVPELTREDVQKNVDLSGHSQYFYIVGPDGKVSDVQNSRDVDAIPQLLAKVKAISGQASQLSP